MKHSIRQRVINQYGLPVVKVEQVNGELGSGVLDKNGKEIFEGDKVRDNMGNEYTMRKKFYFADKDCAELDRDIGWYEPEEIEVVRARGGVKMNYKSMFQDTELDGSARRCMAEIAEIGAAYYPLVYWRTSALDVVIAELEGATGTKSDYATHELDEMDDARGKALSVLECMLVNKIGEFNTITDRIHKLKHADD